MSAHFPDGETMRAVLYLAAMAPSVHNSQPWHWEVGSDRLHLYADSSRLPSRTDSDRRDMLISCGAALHHCTVALAAVGWQAKIHRFPNPGAPDYLAWIEVYRQAPADHDVSLTEAISERRTDRRNFASWPVAMGDIALMGARAARAGVMLRQIDLMPKLTEAVASSVRHYVRDSDYLSEMNSWSGRHGSVGGALVHSARVSDLTARMPARVCTGGHRQQPVEVLADVDNAAILALGTESDDDLARLRAGEATSLVLLSATALGLATCPVTELLEVPETREEVRDDVFGTSGYPQMMLRIGWAPPGSDPLPATSRRPLGETVHGLDDAVLAG